MAFAANSRSGLFDGRRFGNSRHPKAREEQIFREVYTAGQNATGGSQLSTVYDDAKVGDPGNG